MDAGMDIGAAGAQGGAGVGGGGAGSGGAGGGAGGAAGSGAAGAGGAGGTMAVNYCDRTKWIPNSSVNPASAAQGIDGNLTTRFTTLRPMQAGDYYQVDFTGAVNLTAVTSNNTQTSPDDYAATFTVYSSTNGTTWTMVASGPGVKNMTTISFAKTQMRYVRLQVTTANPNTGLYYSIGEFQVACSP
jgi:hypothetical protein